MNIVQGVHEKMRIKLILQVLQFRFQMLMFQFLKHFLIVKRFQEETYGQVKTYQQDSYRNMYQQKRRMHRAYRMYFFLIRRKYGKMLHVGHVEDRILHDKLFMLTESRVRIEHLYTSRKIQKQDTDGKNQRQNVARIVFLEQEAWNEYIVMYQKQQKERKHHKPGITYLFPQFASLQRMIIVEQKTDERSSQYQHPNGKINNLFEK
ncbi:hypothetical protein BACCOP_00624 [Phocaeicola coprocola DSM 17136]|uniref:Uncharacterized protein n=1 Tax=Phocaeicola coprocola DSM 17136 TaxID=470145 RepID=B3JFH4_9BACT|nr:hypothetical protein BACCOP_00624 [Phocaeicola coprocola DSM 17136]